MTKNRRILSLVKKKEETVKIHLLRSLSKFKRLRPREKFKKNSEAKIRIDETL